MLGFLNEYASYAKLLAGAILLSICFYIGFHIGNSRYLEYKSKVEIAQKEQEAKVESIQKQHELITKGVSDEYEAKLVALRNYYKSTSVWNNSSSNMSGLSTTPKSADVISAHNELIGNCAQTTLMLVELQKWINEQVGIK